MAQETINAVMDQATDISAGSTELRVNAVLHLLCRGVVGSREIGIRVRVQIGTRLNIHILLLRSLRGIGRRRGILYALNTLLLHRR